MRLFTVTVVLIRYRVENLGLDQFGRAEFQVDWAGPGLYDQNFGWAALVTQRFSRGPGRPGSDSYDPDTIWKLPMESLNHRYLFIRSSWINLIRICYKLVLDIKIIIISFLFYHVCRKIFNKIVKMFPIVDVDHVVVSTIFKPIGFEFETSR